MTAEGKQIHDKDAWMSLRQAARAIGEGRFALQSRIGRDELVTLHVGNRTFVRRDSVDALIAARAAEKSDAVA